MNNYKMPSPEELAKKDKTTNISLRIKKSAADIFEALAKEQNSKPGTMMISLIENYADNYRNQAQEDGRDVISPKVIDAYLSKVAERIGKMNESDMLLKISQSPTLMKRILDENDMENLGHLEHYLDTLKKGDTKGGIVKHSPMVTFGAQGYYTVELICAYDNTPSLLEEYEHEKGEVYEDSLYLSSKKWLSTIILLAKYEAKMNEVMPQWSILITEEIVRKIAEAARMENDTIAYTNSLAKILSDFVAEQCEEGK